jgi:hypothetical protein
MAIRMNGTRIYQMKLGVSPPPVLIVTVDVSVPVVVTVEPAVV